MSRVASIAARLSIVAALGCYFYAGAMAHARAVNQIKARGDQSAYLWEAQILYRNWHGLNDPPVVQPRNRMPLYPAYLASFYNPQWSDAEYFEIAKVRSVGLSLVLLAVMGAVSWRLLPPLPAANLILIVAFGYYVFRAGYVQSEPLFYALHFLTFVACWHLLSGRHAPGARTVIGLLAGVLAALAHLTKAAMLPFVALVLLVSLGSSVLRLVRMRDLAGFGRALIAPALLAAAFLLVLFPYISTSKRVHGQYFYNLNTAVLMWYDDYPQAAGALLAYGPDGWPDGPRSMRPGPLNYWRTHGASEIASRFGGGFRDMVVQSYRTFWYLKFVVLYLVAALVLVTTRWSAFRPVLRRHALLATFCFLYAAAYLPAIAFYEPISGTGTTRFLIAHVAPLLFALSALLAGRTASAERWVVRGVTVTAPSFHFFIAATLAFDVAFLLWWRLMTTYGGF
jgi:hypothetical protein